MAMHNDNGGSPIAAQSGMVSTRRLLAVCSALLMGFALLLGGASHLGGRLHQPLDRIPLATYAARRGIALPSTPVVLPGDQGVAGMVSATPTVGRRTAAPGTASPTLQIPAVIDPQLAADLMTTYLRAWERWAEACLTLDAAPLALVFASPELDRVRDYVQRLRASGRALRLDAAHRVTVLELGADEALLLDDLTDRSLYLDPATRQPLPAVAQPTPVGTERVYCRLRRTEAGWRVVDLSWDH